MLIVEESNFDNIITKEFEKDKIVILKFMTEYCDACMMLGFELDELEDEFENISILEIDCAESQILAQKYGITEVPHTIIYKNKDTILLNKSGIILAQDIAKIIKD